MKKYAIYLVAISLLAASGCNKDGFFSPPQVKDHQDIDLGYYLKNSKTPPTYPGVSSVNGIIRFQDDAAFERTFRTLDREDEQINDRFFSEWGHLDADALEAKEIELGFDEDIALFYFENTFGHASLRNVQVQKEQAWLDSNEPDPNLDPGLHIVRDRILQSILNEQNEVMIGESIFKIMHNGVVYEIKDGNVQTAQQIMEIHAATPFQAANVKIHHQELLGTGKVLGGACKMLAGGRTVWHFYNGNTRRFRGYLGQRNFVFYGGTLSTTTSYRKVNGKWRKRRASLRTSNRGHVVFGEPDCEGNMTAFDSKEKSKYRRHIEKRYVHYFGQPDFSRIARIESGWLHSNHYCNGNDVDFTLIW